MTNEPGSQPFDPSSLPWIPLGPGESFKPICFFPGDRGRVLLLRLEPGVEVPKHRHLGEVHAVNLSGQRLLIESNEVVGPGAYVYEPEQSVANAIVSLPEGSMHYVTGAMPKDHTTIYTPTATMVLNGSDISVGVNDRGNTHLLVENGSVTVRSRTTGQQMVYSAGESVDITPSGITTSTAALQ